jgi:hypothetical protein
MQALTIAIVLNIILSVALVSLVFYPSVIRLLKKKKNLREIKEKQRIRRFVREYLEELRK